jgi:septal ring factor EnvC (AmiA/AmiB activator)
MIEHLKIAILSIFMMVGTIISIFLCYTYSLEQEKKTRTAVENELKSARDMAQGLEKQVNEDFVKCQDHQKRIAELEAANKKLEAANKNLDKQKYHMELQANKNMEHMQTVLKEEKRKADDQYKKLLAERDDLRDRLVRSVETILRIFSSPVTK